MIYGKVRRAIADYDMIQEGDNVAIGLSGGKDSMSLLITLASLRRYYPKKFNLYAITLLLGIGEFDTAPVEALCRELDVPYTIVPTQIGELLFEVRKEKNPCSLCANLRRGALHTTAKSLGCNKVVLGHHRDDVLETFLLSAFYEGRLHTMQPVTYLDRTGLTLIRPLIYVEEKEIKAFVKSENIPIVKSPCPMDGYTKRTYMKELLMELRKDNKEIKSNLFGAIRRSGIDGWIDPEANP